MAALALPHLPQLERQVPGTRGGVRTLDPPLLQDPEPEPPPEPRVHRATRVEPRAPAPDLPGRAPAGPAGCPCCPPGAGRHGNRWNWGSAFFANGALASRSRPPHPLRQGAALGRSAR